MLIIMKKPYAILIGHSKPWLHHIASWYHTRKLYLDTIFSMNEQLLSLQ